MTAQSDKKPTMYYAHRRNNTIKFMVTPKRSVCAGGEKVSVMEVGADIIESKSQYQVK